MKAIKYCLIKLALMASLACLPAPARARSFFQRQFALGQSVQLWIDASGPHAITNGYLRATAPDLSANYVSALFAYSRARWFGPHYADKYDMDAFGDAFEDVYDLIPSPPGGPECIRARAGVTCTGWQGWRFKSADDFAGQLVGVASRAYDACTVDAERVQCEDGYGRKTLSARASGAMEIAAAISFVCLTDQHYGLRCWGGRTGGERLRLPAMDDPKSLISNGLDRICARDRDRGLCWGPAGDVLIEIKIPGLWDIIPYGEGLCGISAAGVACKGGHDRYWRDDLRQLQYDLSGPTSWLPIFDLDRVAEWIRVAKASSGGARARLFANLTATSENLSVDDREARAFLARLLGPAVELSDAYYFIDRFAPAYRHSLERIQSKESFAFAPRPELARVAWKFLQASIAAGEPYVAQNRRAALASVVRAIGFAMASPDDAARRAEAIALFRAASDALRGAREPERGGDFLLVGALAAINWIETGRLP